MFRLISLLKLKSGAPVGDLQRQMEALLSEERSVLRFSVLRDAGIQEHFVVQHATLALFCEFDSAERWSEYVTSSTHQALSKLLAPWHDQVMVLHAAS